MKRLFDFDGGRNLVNEDMEAIQQSLDLLMSMYSETGPFVIRGLKFTLSSGSLYNVSAGSVMLNGRVIDVPAMQMDLSSSKAISEAAVQDVDDREFTLLSTTKTGNKLYQHAITAGGGPLNPGDNIFITAPSGGFPPQVRRFHHALQEMVYQPKTILIVRDDIASEFVAFDQQGRNDWLGWRLRTASPGPVNPVDLRDYSFIGVGGYSVDDDAVVQAASGSSTLLNIYGVHYVEFEGTRDTMTNTF